MDARIELALHAPMSERRYRELAAFAAYCIVRIEHNVGRARRWTVSVRCTSDGYACDVTVDDAGPVVAATRAGRDMALVVWEALCRAEQRLLESRRRVRFAS